MSAVLRGLGTLVLVGVIAIVGLGAVVVLGVRAKHPPVLRAVGRFARDVGNPKVLQTAGTAGSRNHVVVHVGRTSGREYRTPITATGVTGGYVIALPYGSTTDWVRNVLAAGEATLVIDGREIALVHPHLIPLAQVAEALSPQERALLGLFGVREFLRLEHRPST